MSDATVSRPCSSVKDVKIFKSPTSQNKASKSRIKILEEDTYLSEMGKIIERDFFPDLEKLRAQNDYLEALERNDMQKIRDLHAKYSSGKTPLHNIYTPSPATFETPIDTRPSDCDTRPKADDQNTIDDDDIESCLNSFPCDPSKEKKLSLDQYLGSHTSEDNQSFQEIIKESEIKHRLKNSWLYEAEGNNQSKKNLIVPSIEEQAAGKDRPLNLDTWDFKSKNYIMYVPDGVDLTQQEKIEQAKAKQEISHFNTRLAKCPFDETQNKETIQGLAINQSRVLEGKIGVDGKELVTFGETPKLNGFSFVKTPSPAPGVNESPLMTWGSIDGTPFRLDGGDTPLIASTGPSFKIPEPPKREKLALALAEKAGERHRDRKNKAILAAQRQLASPSPGRSSGSSLERLNSMSPAAQKLASSQLKRIASDRSLQASYSPALRTPSSTPSPVSVRTPKSAHSTPNQKTAYFKSPGLTPKRAQHITDNLLNLPKRPRAADYFND